MQTRHHSILTFLFASLGLFPKTITGIFFLALIAAIYVVQIYPRRVWSIFPISPFFPFAMVCVLIGLGSLDSFLGRQLVALGLVYVLAMLVRKLVSMEALLSGIAFGGFLVAGVSFAGRVIPEDLFPSLEIFAAGLGKNPPAWLLSISLVILAGLLSNGQNLSLSRQIFSWALILIGGAMLFVAGSTTAVLAFIAGLAAVLLMNSLSADSAWAKIKTPPNKLLLLFLAILSGLVALVTFSNLLPGLAPLVRRDYRTLTGRTSIWECYFENLDILPDPHAFEQTAKCSELNLAHLHNVLLEAHLQLGPAGIISLALGLLMSFVILRRREAVGGVEQRRSVRIGVLVAVFLIGMVESAIFWETAAVAFVLFAIEPDFPNSPRPNELVRKVISQLGGLETANSSAGIMRRNRNRKA